MIDVIRNRLRFVFSPRGDEPAAESAALETAPARLPEVEFVAYAEDCRLFGHLRLERERLTDMLNDYDEYLLVDVLAESLEDGRVVETKEIVIRRDEVLAVEATGPRGRDSRRIRTRPHPMGLKVGPYLVQGYLHALPGADPMSAVRRRGPMIPLTHAWIAYASGGMRRFREASTLVVNRELTDWIAPATDEAIEFPNIPIMADEGPLLKDFTGQILLPDAF